MIPPWPSPYEGPPDQLPYHLRSADRLSADEPWIGALYLDGPNSVAEPAPAAAGRPSARNPGDGAAAGATTDSHQEGRSGLGVRTPAAAAVSGERPQLEERGPVPPTAGKGRGPAQPQWPAAAHPDDRPPGPTATTATGRPGGHHVAGETAAGPARPGAGPVPGAGAAVPSATRDGDRDDTGLQADRAVRPAPAVLSAPRTEPGGIGTGHVPPQGAGVLSPDLPGSPNAAGARGRHRAERPGTAGAVAVPGRAVLRWLEVWVPRLVGLALIFTGSAGAGALVAVLVAAYGRR